MVEKSGFIFLHPSTNNLPSDNLVSKDFFLLLQVNLA